MSIFAQQQHMAIVSSIIISGLHDVTTSNLYGAIALFKLSGNHIIK